MSVGSLLFFGFIVIVLIYGVVVYNNLVQVKYVVLKVWVNIDVLFKQCYDELFKLVEVCKQYKQFEVGMLECVIVVWVQVYIVCESQNIEVLGEVEGMLCQGLGCFFVVVEVYFELCVNESFMQLQMCIFQLENVIVDWCEFYNESVNINNVCIEQFFDVIVVWLFYFEVKFLFEFLMVEKVDVDVKLLFS